MPEATRDRIAANVRAEVARQRKTQAHIAAVLGRTQQTVSAKFRGDTAFTADEVAAISAELGISVAVLIGEPERAA